MLGQGQADRSLSRLELCLGSAESASRRPQRRCATAQVQYRSLSVRAPGGGHSRDHSRCNVSGKEIGLSLPYIFANAYLTIAAAYGDLYTGLLPISPKRPRDSKAGGSTKDHNELLRQSKWNTRGWTLQEHLYSRRTVFFFQDAVTWECHCELWQKSSLISMPKLRGSNRHECTNRLSSAILGYQHTPWPDLDEYARIAADYSARRVTHVEDTLRAFSGITSMLSRTFSDGFMYGMPLMFLDVALLWRPQASIRRRAPPRAPFLPSWSWMGWWFDGVPVDLVLWRAAADYVEETSPAKVGSNQTGLPQFP